MITTHCYQRLYVSERGNHRIQIFKIVHKEKVEPQTDAELQALVRLRRQQTQAALAGEEVEWEQLVEFELIFTLGHEGVLNSQFKFPVQMTVKALTHTAQLWVVDSLNDRIQVFDLDNNWEHMTNIGTRENKIKPKNLKLEARIPIHRKPVLMSCPTGVCIVGGMWLEDPAAMRDLDVEEDFNDDGLGEDILKLGIGDDEK